jgi:hypothetical protein
MTYFKTGHPHESGDSINTLILLAVPMGNNIFARYLQQPTEYQLST